MSESNPITEQLLAEIKIHLFELSIGKANPPCIQRVAFALKSGESLGYVYSLLLS